MQWDVFSTIVLTVCYYFLIWCLVAGPAALAVYAIAQFFPVVPGEVAKRIMAFGPGASQASSIFLAAVDAAQARLNVGTVRILLDRKHARLKKELEKIRRVLDRQLNRISRATGSNSGASLLDLLQGFQADTERALDLTVLDEQLPDRAVARSKAKTVFWFMLIFMLVFIVINFGLLFLFFDEFFAGQTIPFLGIQLAVVAALIFPLFEAAGGVGSELALEKNDGPGARVIITSGIAFVMLALASLEFFIFYQLFAGGFELTEDFGRGGFVHYCVAAVGPALTIIEGIFGFALARNFLRLREFDAIGSIKKQVRLQKSFVEGLESRYERIDEAAARAGESLDELTAQVAGRGEATVSIAKELDEQRVKFLAEMDSVNPRKWSQHAAASEGDANAVTQFAWFIPIGLVIVIAVFGYVFQDSLIDSGLITERWLAVSLAALVPIASFVTGGWIFERTTSAVDLDGRWKDVFSPRDSAFKIAGVFLIGLLSVGTIWICSAAHGITGLALGLLLVGFLAALSWVGSYIDLALRGLAYLSTIIWTSIIWLLTTLKTLSHAFLVFIMAALAAISVLFLQIAAYPFTLIIRIFRRKPIAMAAGRLT